ncbi:MAG TPA: heavy metal-binding domain-containing protein, partial [Candidatus Polarisedimenticolia bacterium]|nr:heavy metal-binding domain-containing protein [Candidatus Polarisedimenticolia bacterium]
MAPETDPVCGMQVDPAAAPATWEHAGRAYYFCCSGCRDAFASDPAGYLGRAAARPDAHARPASAPPPLPAAPPSAATAPPSASAVYTCPMHPEVVRDRPGSCPICGMALEPRTISAREEENPELRAMTWRLLIGALLTA